MLGSWQGQVKKQAFPGDMKKEFGRQMVLEED